MSHVESQCDCAEARRAYVGDAEGQRASAEQQKADARGFRVTQRPRGLTQSLKEELERFSWSRLAEYLLPKRGITAR